MWGVRLTCHTRSVTSNRCGSSWSQESTLKLRRPYTKESVPEADWVRAVPLATLTPAHGAGGGMSVQATIVRPSPGANKEGAGGKRA
eukprot:CAMPEP_0181243864 /NCGR_PEP_ID=MMETSP1096-20121128/42519_1 /TAXON_ID=156174 ORGANISM="Chrysochromulina ericina, Strain CCMP281" /NCGR_SAMPLE_ID=MMETSP1096 /ASSEMBLY_ACC=CAM_ASM_000453 /LENGTH=86 /DNA_ID=CAMNT_0023340305 /DNA_START=84 /DNA_END=344 /DNA_ORIENTATION=+